MLNLGIRILWIAIDVVAGLVVVVAMLVIWPGIIITMALYAGQVEELDTWERNVAIMVIFLTSFLWLMVWACAINRVIL